jgi:uncharacterized protein (TIGR03437 family)
MQIPTNPNTAAECRDAFAARLDTGGTQILWSSFLGGPDNDSAEAMTLGPGGEVLLAGYGFAGVPVPGTKKASAFVARIAPDGVQPLIPSNGVVSSGGFMTGIAPGGLASIFGVQLSPVTGIVQAGALPLPLELGQTSVWFDGVAAPMLAVANFRGSEQINAQVPFEAASNGSTLIVRNKGTMGFAFNLNGKYTNPGIFTGGDGQAAAQHAKDYSAITQANPAKASEKIILYVTGLGPLNGQVQTGAPPAGIVHTKETVTVTIGGANANIDFAGLSGYVGLYQINVFVPQVSAGLKDLIVTVAGASSNTAKLAVQ